MAPVSLICLFFQLADLVLERLDVPVVFEDMLVNRHEFDEI